MTIQVFFKSSKKQEAGGFGKKKEKTAKKTVI